MSTEIAVGQSADEITRRLGEPFEAAEIKFKPQVVKGARALAVAYVDARVVQDRLDDVVGVGGWRTEYQRVGEDSVECRLSLKINGEWVTKADVGSTSEQPDAGDRLKAAYSDALKRAAVQFGIGRYLYRLSHQWADYDGVKKQFTTVPTLPRWALPAPQTHVQQLPAAPQKHALPAAKPGPAEQDNLDRRQQAIDCYRECTSFARYDELNAMVKEDAEARLFSKADLDAIRTEAKKCADRLRQAALPPQADATAKSAPPKGGEELALEKVQEMFAARKSVKDGEELGAAIEMLKRSLGDRLELPDLEESVCTALGTDSWNYGNLTGPQVKAAWSAVKAYVKGMVEPVGV